MFRWLSMLWQRVTTVRNPLSVARSDERVAERTILAEQKIQKEEEAAEGEGRADLVAADMQRIAQLIRIRNDRLIDIFDRVGILVRRQLQLLSYIKQSADVGIRTEERQKLDAAIQQDYERLTKLTTSILSQEASFDSTSFSALQALDLGSLAHAEFADLQRARKRAKRIKREEKWLSSKTRTFTASNEQAVQQKEGQLDNDVTQEIQYLASAINELIVMLQKSIKDAQAQQRKIEQLKLDGFPSSLLKQINVPLEEEQKRLREQLHEQIERQRIRISEAQRMVA